MDVFPEVLGPQVCPSSELGWRQMPAFYGEVGLYILDQSCPEAAQRCPGEGEGLNFF